jgi:nitrogenase iron protein NifH
MEDMVYELVFNYGRNAWYSHHAARRTLFVLRCLSVLTARVRPSRKSKEYTVLKIAVYGKGGIGKSTITSNLAAAFATQGRRVIQIGCDPKADSTINLLGGEPLKPIMNLMRESDTDPERIDEIAREGFGGVLCIETGGPTPGLGCAGRGIIATFNLLEDLRLFETWQPDVVLYDVLGDVVCGGFAAPIREGYAEKVLIVTSGEKMALYAANNINTAVENFEDRGYARVAGIILNHRDVDRETEKVQAFASEHNLPVVAEIPRSADIIRFEEEGKTVIEGDSTLPVSQRFLDLAAKLWNNEV